MNTLPTTQKSQNLILHFFYRLCFILLFANFGWGQTTTTVFSDAFGTAAASPFTGSTSTPTVTYTSASSATGIGSGAISRSNSTTGSDAALQILSGDSSNSTTGTITSGSPTVTAVVSNTGITVGIYVSGTGIPVGTTVTAISGSTTPYTLTLSANATVSATASPLNFGISTKYQSDGITYLSGALSSLSSPFNSTLASNPGDVTWFFHMKTNRPTFPLSGFSASNYAGGTVLVGTTSNLNTGNGYAVIFEKGNTAVGVTTTGSTAVTLTAPNTGIVVGQTVTGTNLGSNSTVSSISGVNLVLSTPVTTGNSSRTLTFTSIASGTTTSGSPTVTLVDSPINSNIVVGQFITGSGIPVSTIVSGISGTTLTLSASATASASGVALTIGVCTTVKLVRFTNGLQAGTRVPLIVPTAEFFVDGTKSNWAAIKVVYTPSTNTWAMSLRNDGSGSSSPSTSTSGMTSVGTSVESTYTNTAMSSFGFLFNHGSGSSTGSTFSFDNFSCTVASTNPTVTLPTVASITATSAVLGATATAGSPAALTRGTLYKTATGVAFSDNLLAEGGTMAGLYTHIRSSLSPETLYYFKGYATNVASTSTYAGLSTESSFRTLSSPPTAQASSLTATGVSSTQVDVAWSAATFPSSGATAKQYLLLRATSPNSPVFTGANGAAPTVDANTTIVSSTVSSAATAYSVTSGLNLSTTYNFKLIPYTFDGTNAVTYNYLTASAPIASGTTTAGAAPTLSTPTATSITAVSAVLGATIDSDSGTAITDRGTVWSSVSPVTVLNNLLSETGTATGAFSHSRTGLSPQTQYFFKGYASNASTGLSAEGSFRTLSIAPTAAATSFAATAASGEQINLSWASATFPGSGATTKGYVLLRAVYPTVPTLSNGNAAAPAADSGTTIVSSTIADAATSASSIGLSGSTRYNYAIIPFAWDGINANTYNYYRTSVPTANTTTLSATPSAQPTGLNYSTVSCNSLTVNWTAATATPDGYIVLQTSGATAPDTNPINGTTYMPGATLGNATVAYVGISNSVARSGLADNTNYNFKIYSYNGTAASTSYLTTSPLSGSQATTTAAAPNATTASSIYSNAFTANWDAVTSCANSYLLDVATTNSFSGNGIIAADTFENSLALFTSNGIIGTNSNFKSGNTVNSNDRPLNTPYYSEGTYGFAENGSGASTPVELTSSAINTLAYSNVQMSFKLASLSVSASTGGNDAADDVTVSVSPDGGTTYYPTVLVNGSATGNSVWSFAESGIATTPYDGNATVVNFSGTSAAGVSDGSGYSTVKITGLPNVSSLKIKIAMKSSSGSEYWVIDDFKVTGDASSFSILPSYNGLAVAGTSQQITGLTANTPYYYRVRAVGTNGNSSYSNVIAATTLVASAPTVTSPTVSSITNNGAILGATVSTSGSTATISARGTVYKTTSPVTANDNSLAEGGTGISSFTHSRSLSAQTQYFYAGYATNVSFTGLSTESSFYTLSNPPTAAASSLVATTFSGAQIDLSWVTATFPSSGATTKGYVLLRANYPTVPSLSNSNGQAPAAGSGTTIVSSTILGTATSASSSSLNGLTRYNYVIIPFTWNGSNTATYNYYTTSAPMADATTTAALAALPTNQPTALSFTAVTCNAMNVNWSAAIGTPESYIVLQTSGAVAPNTNPVSSNEYSVGAILGNATVAYIGSGTSFALSSLPDTTTYNFKIYSFNGSGSLSNYLTTAPLSGTNATNSVAAPTATSASSVTTTSFVANWTAPVACANSYLLDISNNNLFPASATITQDNFENAQSLFTATGTGAFYSGNSGIAAEPASSPYFSQGTYGFGVTSGTATITSSDINTTITSSAQLSFKLGAFGNALGTGMESSDTAIVDISPDGGTNWYPTVTIRGNGNSNWPFTATGTASTAYDGDATAVVFTPPAGISTTAYSSVIISGLPLVTNLKVRITLLNNASSERWVVDELKITDVSYVATATTALNSNSSAITGLTPDTNYYYRVRALATNSTSSNSNIITIRTLADPTVADFRAKANGNFSDASTWEYADGTGYTAATVAPLSSNSISIPSGKTVTMDTDFSINSGKTFNVATGGTLDFGTKVVSGSGGFSLASGATMKTGNAMGISGSITATTISLNPAANYTYNGSVAQTTAGLTTTTGTVTISNTAGVTLDANKTVNTPGTLIVTGTGKLLFGSGISTATFSLSGTGGFTASTGSTIVITNSGGIVSGSTTSGNIRVSGTRLFEDNVNYNFTKADGTIASNMGSAFGTDINAATGINNLTVNNSNSLTVNGTSSITVNGTLTLTSGNLVTGSNTVTLAATASIARTSGYVAGSLKINIPTSATSVIFEIGSALTYRPVTLNFASIATAGSITMNGTSGTGTHPNLGTSIINSAKSVSPYFTVTNAGLVFSTCSATFNFVSGDTSGTPTNYVVGNYDGATWTYPTVSSAAATSTTVTGLSAFGDFVIGEYNSSLSATSLAAFANQCINTTSAANTFTLSGVNTGAITIGNVPGFTFSLEGTEFLSSLIFTPVTSSFTQQIWVEFTPTAIQSYSGNSLISGGEASSINVAITGVGIATSTTTPTSIATPTSTGVSVTGFYSEGCLPVTGYGLYYSSTDGFANGTGTQVAGTGGANFTAVIADGQLQSNTTYYYTLYATDGVTPVYGTQHSFTTLAGLATITTTAATAITAFTASTGGNLTNTGGNTITARGIVYGTTSNPTLANSVVADGITTTGIFGTALSGLTAATTYHARAFATNSAGTVFGNDITFTTVAISYWTGTVSSIWANPANWSTGITPTSQTDVVIASVTNQPVIAADITINSLTINTGASLTVPSGIDLTVANAITTVGSGIMTVNSGANLLQTNPLAINSGNINVKRDSAPIVRLDHTLWSSPVTGSQTLLQFSPNTLVNRFYNYSTANNGYSAVTNPSTTVFQKGLGVAIRASNTQPTPVAPAPLLGTSWAGTFTGVPTNGSFDVAVGLKPGTNYGYNLLGNPYPSAIDGATFLTNNPRLDGTLYFYCHTLTMDALGAFPSGTNYATWTSGTGGTAASIGNGHSPAYAPDGTIQVGQGFIVKATSAGPVNFINGLRTGNNTSPFLRSASIERNRMWLNLKTDTGTDLNQILVGYIEGATQDFDTNFDGLAFGTTGSSLSSKIGTADYAVQGRSLPFVSNDLVSLGFKAAAIGNYIISLTETDGLFAGSQDIFLRDNLMGTDHNIKVSPYTFASDAGTFDSRFELVYTQALGIPSMDFTPNSVIVYKNTDWFHLSTKGITMKDIQVYDVSGRLIYKQSDINATTTVLRGLTQTNEVLFLKITSEDNVTVTVKVIN